MWTRRTVIPVVLGALAIVACGTMLGGVFYDALRPPGLKDWTRNLRTGEPEDRLAAAQRLGHVRPAEVDSVLPDLILALKDRDPSVRAMAAESLGDAVAGAVPSFQGKRGDQPAAAMRALVRAMQEDEEQEVRMSATNSIYLICRATHPLNRSDGEPAPDPVPLVAAQPLAASLLAELERDPETRSSVVAALGVLGTELIEPPQALLKLLQEPKASTRAMAIWSLWHFPRGIDPAIPVLLHDLESAPFSLRSDLESAALRFKPTPAVLPPVMQALGSSNAAVQRAAIHLLGNLGPAAREATPALMALLKESLETKEKENDFTRQQLRRDTARTLGQVGSAAEVVSALSEMLLTPDPASRDAAASVLGDLGPQAHGAIPVLVEVMKQAGAVPGVSGYGATTAEALGRIAPNAPDAALWSDKAVAALTGALGSGAAPTRSAAAWALGRFGPKAASSLTALRTLQSDKDENVRRAVTNSLAQIEGAGTSNNSASR